MQDQKLFSAWTIRAFAVVGAVFVLVGSLFVSAPAVLSGFGGFLIGELPIRNGPTLSAAISAAVLLEGLKLIVHIPYFARLKRGDAIRQSISSDAPAWVLVLFFLLIAVTTAFWALSEEMAFRWWPVYLLTHRGVDLGWTWLALVTANVVFALFHLPNFKKGSRQPWRVIPHFMSGLAYAYLFAEFGLVSAWAAHFLHNFVLKAAHITDRALHPVASEESDLEG